MAKVVYKKPKVDERTLALNRKFIYLYCTHS